MPRILITGMSGAGKSTLLAELARRCHLTVDTDYDGWTDGDGAPRRCGPARGVSPTRAQYTYSMSSTPSVRNASCARTRCITDRSSKQTISA